MTRAKLATVSLVSVAGVCSVIAILAMVPWGAPGSRLMIGTLAGTQLAVDMWILAGMACVILCISGLSRWSADAPSIEVGARILGIAMLVLGSIAGLNLAFWIWIFSGFSGHDLRVPGQTGTRILVSELTLHHISFEVLVGSGWSVHRYPTSLEETTRRYSPFDTGEYRVEASGGWIIVTYALQPGGALDGRFVVPTY